MAERVNDDTVERLEFLAARFYPGQFVVIDEKVDDLLGRPCIRASIVVGMSPGLGPKAVSTIGLAWFRPLASRSLPEGWEEVLACSKGRPWRVDLFVQRDDVSRVRKMVREMGSAAGVNALPVNAG
jgi:hypothetical protein